jgi:putative endonuclease
MRKGGFVYIMANKKYGTLYTGVTAHLVPRVYGHRTGMGSKFTSKYHVHQLVWFEAHESIQSAIQRETSLKRWKRDWKIALIEQVNPEWADLYEQLE